VEVVQVVIPLHIAATVRNRGLGTTLALPLRRLKDKGRSEASNLHGANRRINMAIVEAFIVFCAVAVFSISIAAGLTYGCFRILELVLRYGVGMGSRPSAPRLAVSPLLPRSHLRTM
jgi:hypothetical protein